MSVNLNEFTVDQLQYAIELFQENIDDLNHKLQALEDLHQGDVRTDLELFYSKQFDTAILFKVQLMNAKDEVYAREQTFSN